MSNNAEERKLAAFIASFWDNPYGFVLAVFPWGLPTLPDGSVNPLRDKRIEDWQREELIKLGEHIKDNAIRRELGLELLVWRSAYVSGHDVGKSAFVAWIILFLMSTRVDTRGVVTATTQFQLEDKTWPELAKWLNLAINRHWWEWRAQSLSFAAYPEERRKNYRTTAATVSEDNTEAFAGLHNEGRTVFVLFDEASGVKPKIWEVAEGVLYDGEAFFFALGNGTRAEGEFVDCFDKHAQLFTSLRHIDSREVSFTNKGALAQSVIKLGGEDSDEVKVRIRGLFPSQSFNGFINVDAVEEAFEREHVADPDAGLIMAIDVARFGNDKTVFGWRQGRDARSRKFMSFQGLSTVKVAELAITQIGITQPDAVVIESTGPGAGVIDIMRDRGYRIVEVHPGAAATNFEHFANKRAEYWDAMRDAIYTNLCLGDHKQADDEAEDTLFKQLTTIMYSMDRGGQKIQLESKEDMKKRGLKSPDKADTLALTFAVKVPRRDRTKGWQANKRREALTEENPLGF